VLVEEGPAAVAWLIEVGAEFDARAESDAAARRDELTVKPNATTVDSDALAERFALGREAAHSRRRVLHAHGDATGAEIERALVAGVRARPGARVLEHAQARALLVEQGVCRGVLVECGGQTLRVRGRAATVLANGGAGQLWQRTSNPAGATADGVALAWRAGALLADLEFAQFHPTVLVPASGGGDAFLITEAVRGEGAYLRNRAGERFMPRYHADAELAPRDVVARAILSEMLAEGAPSAFLDLRHLPAAAMRARFPTIAQVCARHGLDLARDLIPVAPAAHYFMGGVAVDTLARTSLPGLFAVGEVACTGVHGANRLASNSLLEGLVFGRRAAAHIGELATGAAPLEAAAATLAGVRVPAAVVDPSVAASDVAGRARWVLRQTMWERVSLRRDASGLYAAATALRDLATGGPVDPETGNMLLAAQLIVAAALAREESRGGHFRTDFPERDAARDGQHTLLWAPAAATSAMPASMARAPREAKRE
jgi:L-aspartate oxidase